MLLFTEWFRDNEKKFDWFLGKFVDEIVIKWEIEDWKESKRIQTNKTSDWEIIAWKCSKQKTGFEIRKFCVET